MTKSAPIFRRNLICFSWSARATTHLAPSSFSAEARAWAVARGLVQGGGKLPDVTDNFMWEDLLTREQMATLLYRFALLMGQA